MAVAGTRPNYVKLAPLVRAAAAVGRTLHWIDAGQHTDASLHADMIRDLGLPPADASVVSPPPGPERADAIDLLLRPHLAALRPSVVLVLGDVDATLGAARAAHRLDLPIAHVEAGLRCGDETMPEELNRIAVDALSDRYYTTEPSGARHLAAEGLEPERYAYEAGNVMADAVLVAAASLATSGRIPGEEPPPRPILATLHRQANVDDPARLAAHVDALATIAATRGRVLWPVHPRTAARLGPQVGLAARGIEATPPVAYRAFLQLLWDARAVITDSGGVQVEAALLSTPCVVARGATEHELSLTHGGAVLAGEDPAALPEALDRALAAGRDLPERPGAWDGRAAERIVADLAAGFDRPPRRAPGSPREP